MNLSNDLGCTPEAYRGGTACVRRDKKGQVTFWIQAAGEVRFTSTTVTQK
jgi:hypothetical protein